jgi:hypothetical protein
LSGWEDGGVLKEYASWGWMLESGRARQQRMRAAQKWKAERDVLEVDLDSAASAFIRLVWAPGGEKVVEHPACVPVVRRRRRPGSQLL